MVKISHLHSAWNVAGGLHGCGHGPIAHASTACYAIASAARCDGTFYQGAMLHLDVFGGYVICGAGSVLGAGMMALARPDEPRIRSALNVCSLAFIVLGVGMFQFLFHTHPPAWSILWGAESAVIGTGLFGWGFAKLAGQRVRPQWLYIGLPATAMLLAAVQPLGAKLFALTLDVICLVIGSGIVAVQRLYVLRPRNSAEFALGVSLVFYTATWIARAWGSWWYEGPPLAHLLYLPEPLTTAFSIFYGVIPIIIASLVLNVLNAQLSERLRERALTDELTGLMTRRGLYELADTAQARARARSHCVALLMLDIDHFKRVNDEHGHSAGDEVLRHTAGLIAKTVRSDALVTRYGGEEFVVLLAVPDLGAALQVAERMRSTIAASPCRCRGKLLRVTVSIGVSVWTECEPLLEAMQRSDEALYRAKERGRNRVEADSAGTRPLGPPALRVIVAR